jgi:hypothetical protein
MIRQVPLYIRRAILLVPTSLAAQAPARATIPVLQSTADIRLDARKEQLDGLNFAITLAPDGRVVIAPSEGRGDLRVYDPTASRVLWRVRMGREDSLEIRVATGLGWQGQNLFVIDPAYQQFSIINPQGKVIKSIEYPAWIKPAWADRRKFPIFDDLRPLGLLADGSMLVIPSDPTSPLETPDYDPQYMYVLRVAPTGTIQRTVARLPRDTRIVYSQGMIPNWIGPSDAANRVSANGGTWAASTDGMRVAVVSPGGANEPGLFRLAVLNEKGDTVISRRYAHPAGTVPKRVSDSVAVRARRGKLTERQVDSAIKAFAVSYSAVSNARIGPDHTIWLTFREFEEGRTRMGIDPRGEPIGVFTLPTTFALVTASRDYAWGMEMENRRLAAIVRYRLTPKK